MSRLCRLKTKTHGEDGQWAYSEIVSLRERVAELEAEREKWKSAKLEEFTNIWRVRCEDRDETIERQRCTLFDLREENAELEAQLDYYRGLELVAWRVFDGEGGYDYCGYTDNEDYRDEFIKRNPSPTYKHWVEPLYALEKK